MRLPPLALLLAAAGCAHGPAPRSSPPAETTGTALVVVGYDDPADAAVAAELRQAVAEALRIAERWAPLRWRVTVTVHPSHASLEAAARKPGFAWLRAWARRDAVELQSPRTWSSGGASREELAELLGHELTHCAMYQAIAGAATARTIPIWFREGMASVAAGERYAPVVGAARAGAALTSAALYRTDAALVYATADAAFRRLVDRFGDDAVRGILARLRDGEPFPQAFRAATGVTLEAFEDELGRAAGATGHQG